MIKPVLCPSCKGKGWKRDAVGIVGMTFMFWYALLLDAGADPRKENCVTKEVCSQCDGEGFIMIGR